ncbi:helix-turn-helix domain-containing protein [Enterococcus alishanensis]|uniref:Helix-turn-helix domain-containing protein n=1 Tax=Enterococcus alishanensis TaxID=1303817 RepID=A0ABS6TG06_9ENTE|nr:helix-turn-helix domain-containing protein [Enterococcus alishanensis]
MRLGELLQIYRTKAGLTQVELAQQLFVTPQAISKWEKNLAVPSIDNLIALSEVFNLSIDELLRGSPFFKKPYVVGKKFTMKRLRNFLLLDVLVTGFLIGFRIDLWLAGVIYFIIISGMILPFLIRDYWVIDQKEIYQVGYSSVPFWGMFQLIMRKAKVTRIIYTEMAEAKIRYTKKARFSVVDVSADPMYLDVTKKDGKFVSFDLLNQPRDYLPQFVMFLEHRGVKVKDDDEIVELLLKDVSLYEEFHKAD